MEHLIKKTFTSKNLATRSNYSSNYNNNSLGPDDRAVYTAKAGATIKSYVSPKNLMESARKNYQHHDENPSRSVDPNDTDSVHHYKPSNYYNKATSYLSSQKMTPNTVSVEQQSNSFRGGFTDHKNSYTHFGGSNSRALNSFFS